MEEKCEQQRNVFDSLLAKERELGRKESFDMFKEYIKVTDKNMHLLELELNKRK